MNQLGAGLHCLPRIIQYKKICQAVFLKGVMGPSQKGKEEGLSLRVLSKYFDL